MPDFVAVGAVARAPLGAHRVTYEGPEATFNLNLDRVARRLQSQLPARLLDLLEIACGVYAADQRVARGGRSRAKWGQKWRREFMFRIAVRDVEFWSSGKCRRALSAALGFLTEDSFSFEFEECQAPPPPATYFDFDPELDGGFNADEVVLLSGGLDSLSGTIETLKRTDKRLVVVTHLAAPKVHALQRELVANIKAEYPGRLFWLPVTATLRSTAAADRTQRSRTFLFAAMGLTAAVMFGASVIRFFENGVVSLNLPISEQVVGTTATRTTHPRTVALMQDFARLVAGADIRLDNPFYWLTKSDVVSSLVDNEAAHLIPRTFSCSMVLTSAKLHRHCGCCSQCIDRRFGILAAEAGAHDPSEMYDTDLFLGARSVDRNRTMAVDYVRRAQFCEVASDQDFMTKFGSEVTRTIGCFGALGTGDIISKTIDLHRRHGKEVARVLQHAFEDHFGALVRGECEPTCLLRSLPHGDAERSQRPRAQKERGVDTDLALMDPDALELSIDDDAHIVTVHGLAELVGPAYVIVLALKRLYDMDIAEQRVARDFQPQTASVIADNVGRDEEWVRQNIKRCRDSLAVAYEGIEGERPSEHLLIQTVPKKGYRLDPRVRFVKPPIEVV